jgi:NADH:ubiquinone oxidoreductase subunit B-like Fe-S oxidoreductase
MRQYKFNIDVGPDRLSLQAMEKDNKESIREYARRWSMTATQVNPSMLEKEMISLFSNTFKAPYFEYLVRSSTQHFTDLVVIAERIEQAIGISKIVDPIEKNSFSWKREGH